MSDLLSRGVEEEEEETGSSAVVLEVAFFGGFWVALVAVLMEVVGALLLGCTGEFLAFLDGGGDINTTLSLSVAPLLFTLLSDR